MCLTYLWQLVYRPEHGKAVDEGTLFGRVIIDKTDNVVLSDTLMVNSSQQFFTGVTGADYEKSLQSPSFDRTVLLVIKPNYHPQPRQKQKRAEHIKQKYALRHIGYILKVPANRIYLQYNAKPQKHNN
jgi:hypothetical protein